MSDPLHRIKRARLSGRPKDPSVNLDAWTLRRFASDRCSPDEADYIHSLDERTKTASPPTAGPETPQISLYFSAVGSDVIFSEVRGKLLGCRCQGVIRLAAAKPARSTTHMG